MRKQKRARQRSGRAAGTLILAHLRAPGWRALAGQLAATDERDMNYTGLKTNNQDTIRKVKITRLKNHPFQEIPPPTTPPGCIAIRITRCCKLLLYLLTIHRRTLPGLSLPTFCGRDAELSAKTKH